MSSIWLTIGVARMIKSVCISKGGYAYQRATTQPSRQNDYNTCMYIKGPSMHIKGCLLNQAGSFFNGIPWHNGDNSYNNLLLTLVLLSLDLSFFENTVDLLTKVSLILSEPWHEDIWLCYMRTTKAQTYLHSLLSACAIHYLESIAVKLAPSKLKYSS